MLKASVHQYELPRRLYAYAKYYPNVSFIQALKLYELSVEEIIVIFNANHLFDTPLSFGRGLVYARDKWLQKMQEAEENLTRKTTIQNYVNTLDLYIENDNNVTNEEKVKIRQAIRTLENWGENIDDEDAIKFNHTLTNRLNMLIMSVNDITDKNYIHDFIRKMSVKDSSSLRKYIQQNEPGVDYNIEVERPASLGGGSMKTFLQLDQFLFLNIA